LNQSNQSSSSSSTAVFSSLLARIAAGWLRPHRNNIGSSFATMATTASGQGAVAPATQQTPPGPIYVDTQHEDLVHDAQLDYYGCKLATSSSGKQKRYCHPWSVLA
jgi:hypothetical protein